MRSIESLRRASAEHRLALRKTVGGFSGGTIVQLVRETSRGLVVRAYSDEFEVNEADLVARRPKKR